MIYYTSDLQKVEFTPNRELIASGKQGSVYDYGENKCVKIYGEDVQKYEPEIFALFKELSLEGYCKLYDLLYRDSNLQEVAGYIMQKYINEIENILNMSTEYTINSFEMLYNSVRILAENRIIVRDTTSYNAILSVDGIILIDMDSCNKTTLPVEDVLEVNVNNILYLFRRLFEEGLVKLGKDIADEELSKCLKDIFSYSKEPVKSLKKKLAYSKTPMEVLPFKYRY